MSFLLKAQEVPGTVARVEINAETGAVKEIDRCFVDNVEASRDTVSFRYLAQSLPFPVEDEAVEALKWTPFSRRV